MVAATAAAGAAALEGAVHEAAILVPPTSARQGVKTLTEISEITPKDLDASDGMVEKPELQNNGCGLPWPLSCLCPESKPEKPLVAQENDYDVVFNISKLEDALDRSKGWSLEVRSAHARKALATSSTIKIGIMGVYNRGKTTVTNLLSGRSANVGNLVHTKGLSAVLKDNVAYLDTAGQNQPLNLTRDQDLKTKGSWEESVASETNRRMLRDMFTQDMVIALSDLLVVVVNQLTLEDQRYVRVLEKKVKEFEKASNTSKQLIVVHNMKDVESPEDLEKLISKDILDGFGCEEKTFYGVGNAEYKYWSSPSTVSHCVIARHGSRAGQCVNQHTVDLITSLMQSTFATATSTTTQKNLLQGIDSYVGEHLHNYFDNLKKADCMLNALVKEKGSGTEEMSLFVDSDKLDEGVAIKKEAVVSEWQVIWGAKYELDHECTVVKTADEYNNSRHINVVIDLPGVFEGSPTKAKRKRRKEPFVHTYTWDEGAGPVVTLTLRLASRGGLGPSIEVMACRQEGELLDHQARTNDSGKRGTACLTVPQTQFRDLDAFAGARARMRDNGTLLVTMAEEALSDHDSSDCEALDTKAQGRGAEQGGIQVQETRAKDMPSRKSK